MARSDGTLDYSAASVALNESKCWGGTASVQWVINAKKNGFPDVFGARASVVVSRNGIELRPEGWLVDCYYKESPNAGIPAKLYYSFIVGDTRVYAHDDGGPSRHFNDRAGAGQPHYMQRVGHPHIHRPMPDGVGSYAEPTVSLSPADMWTAFLDGIKMTHAPVMVLPRSEPTQQGLDL